MPDERYLAVQEVRSFLKDLCIPRHTPKVPKRFRQRARSLLWHYPAEAEMKIVSTTLPSLFREHIEPVERMIMQYETKKTRI